MPSSILDAIRKVLTIEVAGKASRLFNEDVDQAATALKAIAPSFLISLLGKIKGEPAAADEVFAMAVEASESPAYREMLSMMGSTEILDAGSAVLQRTLGEKLPLVSEAISGYSNLKKSAVEGLFKMTSPAMLGVLGQQSKQLNLDAAGLAMLLDRERAQIVKALPASLSSIPALFGIDTIASGSSHNRSQRKAVPGNATGGFYPWISYLIGGIIFVLLISYFSKGCGEPKHYREELPAARVNHKGESAAPMQGEVSLQLPDSSHLAVARGSVEDRLTSFLKSDWKAKSDEELKQTWFDFDNLNFESGSANITSASFEQVRNIAAILKAFPDAKIKIGGYTDKVGNDEANKKLSQERANAVKGALEGAGVNPSQLAGAEGYGEEYAKIPETAPDAERQSDRRIALSVRKGEE